MGKGEDTRARILDEALQQASIRGMKGFSLGDLAAGLNLSKSGVLKHFQSMETLVFQWKGILLAYGHSKRLLDDEAARAQATAAYRMLIGG